jgi:hypothetical protein
VPDLLRPYVLDCGAINVADTARYELRRDEVETSELSVACLLVVHPKKGALIWDVGAVPDSEWLATGGTVVHHLSLPDGQTRDSHAPPRCAIGRDWTVPAIDKLKCRGAAKQQVTGRAAARSTATRK